MPSEFEGFRLAIDIEAARDDERNHHTPYYPQIELGAGERDRERRHAVSEASDEGSAEVWPCVSSRSGRATLACEVNEPIMVMSIHRHIALSFSGPYRDLWLLRAHPWVYSDPSPPSPSPISDGQ